MKLIYCFTCGDVVALTFKERECLCGYSKGAYKDDGLHAWISGPCVGLGFHNTSLQAAMRRSKPGSPGKGEEFIAWVMPPDTSRLERREPTAPPPKLPKP